MHDDFVGDIGDYSKYGLLRALNQVGGFRLGITNNRYSVRSGMAEAATLALCENCDVLS